MRSAKKWHSLIRKDGDMYRRDGSDPVAPEDVQALARALGEPANPNPLPADLGITSQWLRDNFYNRKDLIGATTSEEQALFEKKLLRPDSVNAAVAEMYRSFYVDGLTAQVHVQVTFDDGVTLSLSSSRQHAFLLPWSIIRGNSSIQVSAYNANISRAIAALMPSGSTNQGRIAGEGLAGDLGAAFMRPILQEERNKELKIEERRADAAAGPLRSAYRVFFPVIRTGDVPDLWEHRNFSVPTSTTFYASLSSDRLPSNFTEDVTFHYVDGKAVGISAFLRKSRGFEDTIFGVPWLSRFIKANPDVLIRMSFVYDASLTESALDAFVADMHALGKDQLATMVTAAKATTVLFFTGRSVDQATWLVLPNRHVLLWRYNGLRMGSGDAKLLKWNVSDLCDLRANLGYCGAEIAPNGNPLTN